jgi:hypothetical protein
LRTYWTKVSPIPDVVDRTPLPLQGTAISVRGNGKEKAGGIGRGPRVSCRERN